MIKQHINNGLTFSLRQTGRIKENLALFTKDNKNNISLTFYYSGFDCSAGLSNRPAGYQIKFHFQAQYLDNYFSHSSSSYDQQFSDEETQQGLCCNKQLILHEIINNKMHGAYRQMFLESKALALLLCFQACRNKSQSECSACKFLVKPVDKEKVYKARELILSRLNNPLTIPELSLEVGINQCYLKKGFKEIFGTTVYDFVQQQRMLKAKLLLTTTSFSVARIADEIGFSSMSNFSSAFKKYTGIFPSELRKAVA